MSRHACALFAGLVLFVAARSSGAAVLIPVDLQELSRSALAIVHGRVVGVEPQWADGRRRIETLVAIEVRQYLKGDLGPTVVIRIPGGEIGRFRRVMVGAPSFRTGDEVIVFLGAHGPSYPFLLGFGQGVYRVTRDPASGTARVVPPPLTVQANGAGPVVRGAAQVRPWPLERFVEEVRGLATGSPSSDDRNRPRRTDGRGKGGRP